MTLLCSAITWQEFGKAMERAKDAVVDGAVDATGTQGYVNSYTNMQQQAQRYAMNGQNMFNQFNQKK